MKKLDNKGWGLRQMLIISGLLLVCLFVAVYYIKVLTINFPIDV